MIRDIKNREVEERALADPGGFAGAVAWAALRHWNRDLLLAHTEDAEQFCQLLKLEAVSQGIAGSAELTRLARRSVKDFARAYGFDLVHDRGAHRRRDFVERSLEAMVEGYRDSGQEPCGDLELIELFHAPRCFRKSRPPEPEQISEERIVQAVSCNLKRFRKRSGMTARVMSARTGLAVNVIWKTERACQSTKLASLFLLAHCLDLATDSLLTGSERQPAAADFGAYHALFVERLRLMLRMTVQYPTLLLREVMGDEEYVCHLERGRVPSLAAIAKLCQALELWPSYLLREHR